MPASTNFAQAADFQKTLIGLVGDSDSYFIVAAETAPFQLTPIDLSAGVNELIAEVNALPTGSNVIEKLVAPLNRARALLEGTLSNRSLKQAREALTEFQKLVETNRNKLGQPTAELLAASAGQVASDIPNCG